MKVFISWSGEKSKAVATKLREWIPDIINYVEPWLSSEDIDAGARWNKEIAEKLGKIKFGIICLTKSNSEAPWLVFEAGALAKTVDDDTFVCPYLIDMKPSDIPQGPLTQFQCKEITESGTLELIKTINGALGEDALPDDRLERAFKRCWPELNAVLEDLPEEAGTVEEKRPQEEMIEEILDAVRSMSRGITRLEVTPSGLMMPRGKIGLASHIGERDISIIPATSPSVEKSESDSGNGK